jgi:hypothetical protein
MSRHGSDYPPELRERAVRMVAEVQGEYPSQWAAIGAVAQKLGIGRTARRDQEAWFMGRCCCLGRVPIKASVGCCNRQPGPPCCLDQ